MSPLDKKKKDMLIVSFLVFAIIAIFWLVYGFTVHFFPGIAIKIAMAFVPGLFTVQMLVVYVKTIKEIKAGNVA